MSNGYEISTIKINKNGYWNIQLNESKMPISLDIPLFEKTDDKTIKKVPAAFLVDDLNAELAVTVVIHDGYAGNINYKLECRYYNEILFSSDPVNDPLGNEIEFIVKSKTAPYRFFRIRGKQLSWILKKDGTEIPLDPVDIELFWLYEGAKNNLFGKGIPVEVFRDLARSCWVSNEICLNIPKLDHDRNKVIQSRKTLAKQAIIQSVVNYCFFRNPPFYDIKERKHRFIILSDYDNITLYLSYYLKSIDNNEKTCNCIDQAAILQCFLNCIGIADVKFSKLSPFGFMKKSNLTGWGECNNPKKEDGREFNPVVDADNPNRYPFNFHTFCYSEEFNWVLDSCIGPHTGGENKKKYIYNSIDKKFPPNSKLRTIPLANQIQSYKGVKYINFTCAAKEPPSDKIPGAKEFMEKFQKGITDMEEKEKISFVIYDWSKKDLFQGLLDMGYTLIENDPVPGNNEVMKSWELNKDNTWISIKLYITSGEHANKYALNRFFSLRLSDPLPVKGPYYLGRYSAILKSDSRIRLFWCVNNAVFDIHMENMDKKGAEGFCKGLYKLVEKSIREQKDNKYLKEDETIKIAKDINGTIEITSEKIKVGECVSVGIPKSGSELYDFYLTGGGMRFKKETDAGEKHCIEFEAVEPSENTLIIAAVDKGTLLVRNRTFKIIVGGDSSNDL